MAEDGLEFAAVGGPRDQAEEGVVEPVRLFCCAGGFAEVLIDEGKCLERCATDDDVRRGFWWRG